MEQYPDHLPLFVAQLHFFDNSKVWGFGASALSWRAFCPGNFFIYFNSHPSVLSFFFVFYFILFFFIFLGASSKASADCESSGKSHIDGKQK